MRTFRVPASAYLRRIMIRWASRFAPLAAILFFSLLILGCVANAAFLIVALMLTLILVPTAMMFAYYQYALKLRTAMLSSGDTSITVADGSIHISIDRPDSQGYSFDIPFATVREITPGQQFDIIVYGTAPDQFILIGKDAFQSQADRIQFHNYIFDKIPKKSVNSRS